MTHDERDLTEAEGVAKGARIVADAAKQAPRFGLDPIEYAEQTASIKSQEHAELIADVMRRRRMGSRAYELAARQLRENEAEQEKRARILESLKKG